ncbi:MAG: pyridoxamine 5'-phosphate oxidase family protein [Cyanobacteria bacterium J06632_22]
MAKVYPNLTPDLQAFITAQHLFFVASAPLSADGHINLSPKGLDTFRILSPQRVAYLDLTGSGNETSAHLKENGRLTFLFCAFTGKPQILRLYGRGHTVLPEYAEWNGLSQHFTMLPGSRQIIVADLERVQTSCGFGIPEYDYRGQRPTLPDWAEQKGPTGIAAYQQRKGSQSIDGLLTPIGEKTSTPRDSA